MSSVLAPNYPLAISGATLLALSALHFYNGEKELLNSTDKSKDLSDETKDMVRAIWNFSTLNWVASGIVMLKIALRSPIQSPINLILDYFAVVFGGSVFAFLPGYILKRTKRRFYPQIPVFAILGALILWGKKNLH